jgi:hypothetical protein
MQYWRKVSTMGVTKKTKMSRLCYWGLVGLLIKSLFCKKYWGVPYMHSLYTTSSSDPAQRIHWETSGNMALVYLVIGSSSRGMGRGMGALHGDIMDLSWEWTFAVIKWSLPTLEYYTNCGVSYSMLWQGAGTLSSCLQCWSSI